jgi:predicted CoA-binding protein
VVGLSKDPAKDSHRVAMYLKERGYRIVPVNPTADMALEQICFPSLEKIPPLIAGSIEVVDFFRPSEETLEILLQTIKLRGAYGKVKGIWLQEGIKNPKTEKFAKEAGLLFVQNKCMMKEHQKMVGKPKKR